MEQGGGEIMVVGQSNVVSSDIQVSQPASVYIDTCSLINLLTGPKANFLIANLEFWILNNKIQLFTCKVIVEEWNIQKEKHRDAFRQSLQAKYSHTHEVAKIENLTVPKNLQPNTEVYDKLIGRIDDLLKGAVLLEVTKDAKARGAERFVVPRKAPFHNKADSMNDAFIIFTALEYFHRLNQSFIFISDNKGEFASVDDKERRIHPELIEDFPGVEVEYYRDIGWAISDLRKRLGISLTQEESAVTIEVKEPLIKISLDRSQHLLDQLAQYMHIMHQDIVYVPPMFIVNQYPFRIGNQHSSGYGHFNAETSNEKLLDLFVQLSVDQDGAPLPHALQDVFPEVVDAVGKSKEVLRLLTRDLIFSISNNRGGKRISTRFTGDRNTCHCPICEFRRFNFVDALKQLADEPVNEQQYLQLAYANYLCGNYMAATRILQRALPLLKDKNLNTSAFISEFNLSKLGIFLFNSYFKDKDIEQLANLLMAINPAERMPNYAAPHNREVLEYLSEDNFLKSTKEKAHELHYKLLDNYFHSLSGGFSSNTYVWSLINQLAQIDSFLTDNRIIFNKFNEFSNLADRIFEAMFASHAVKAESGSRLVSFDDWILQRMMLYGTAENLNKYYLRYKIKKLAYEREDDQEGTFVDSLNNFFSGVRELSKAVRKYCELDGDSFWDYYNRLFSNAIVLISITQISPPTLMALIGKVIDFLESEDCIDAENLKRVRSLIVRVGMDLDIELLNRAMWVFVQNRKYLKTGCVESICEIYSTRKLKLSVRDAQLDFIKHAYTKVDAGGILQLHSPLIQICRIVQEESVAQELKAIIRNNLHANFRFEIYYESVIFGIIPYDDSDFEKLLASVLPSAGRQEIKGFLLGRPSDRYDGVNHLLNLVFKIGLDTNAARFDVIRKLSPYYEWLLNMEEFDYGNFDPAWISEYKTRYYFRRIASCTKVREYLESQLKDEVISDLEKQYYSIYIRKPWDVREE
ncbi:PIN domain-containing protein [Chryseolinea sp. H1M3-3]|uniref:PIN domain-containing protein n=1 Tax=Chryseolinea sp. H1M3-3 TaxID=3034144 RepID=UPI0023EC7FB8|nr:PIN domain-containing protein [Chryseolinea sp. H1M3-3]